MLGVTFIQHQFKRDWLTEPFHSARGTVPKEPEIQQATFNLMTTDTNYTDHATRRSKLCY